MAGSLNKVQLLGRLGADLKLNKWLMAKMLLIKYSYESNLEDKSSGEEKTDGTGLHF